MILGSVLTVEQWDAMQTKEELYARFEGNPSKYPDPVMGLYFTDGEAKAVVEVLKKAAETVRPVMLDVASHFTDVLEPRKAEAGNIISSDSARTFASKSRRRFALFIFSSILLTFLQPFLA